jgi:hypothetical protein
MQPELARVTNHGARVIVKGLRSDGGALPLEYMNASGVDLEASQQHDRPDAR